MTLEFPREEQAAAIELPDGIATTRWDYKILNKDQLEQLNGITPRKTKDPCLTTPISALYIFGSQNNDFIRPGAVGINRGFNQATNTFSNRGNTAKGRWGQYRPTPGKDVYVGRGENRQLKSAVLPWRANPWYCAWLVQFTNKSLTSPELSIAEQMLHFHIGQAFRFRGNSCYDCPKTDVTKAIGLASDTVRLFRQLAPQIFFPIRNPISAASNP